MIFEIGRWGLALTLGKLEFRFFLGDLFINVPGYLEVSWNVHGLIIDKLYETRRGDDD